MTHATLPSEACPRCNTIAHVVHKLLLIGPMDSRRATSRSVWRKGCSCQAFSADDLKPEFQGMGQFIEGLYCEKCAIGYVPEFMAKPAPPRYRPCPDGWRRVFPDGTLGPLLERISDDPDSGM